MVDRKTEKHQGMFGMSARIMSILVIPFVVASCGVAERVGPTSGGGGMQAAGEFAGGKLGVAECMDFEERACGYAAIGECRPGKQTCIGGKWQACLGAKGPSDEIPNSLDDDCDNLVDEGFEKGCTSVGKTRPCGPAAVGQCKQGVQTCREDGHWSATCDGLVTPVAEVCNGLDDDCDGIPDDSVCVVRVNLGVLEFFPIPWTAGDREFKGHGPYFRIRVEWSRTPHLISAKVYVWMRETTGDWTTVEGYKTFTMNVENVEVVSSDFKAEGTFWGHGWHNVLTESSFLQPSDSVMEFSCVADGPGEDACDDRSAPDCVACRLQLAPLVRISPP